MNLADQIAAISGEVRQVMLFDGTILAIRAFHDENKNEVPTYEDAFSFVVVDHRTRPPTFVSIEASAVEYSPET